MDIGREQALPRTAPGFGRAVGASVLFHAGMVGLAAWMGLQPPGAPALPEPAIQTTIRLIAANPERAPLPVELPPPVETPATELEVLPEESPEKLSEEMPEEELPEEELPDDAVAIAEAVPQQLPAETIPEPAAELDADDAPQSASSDEPASGGVPPGITRETLSNSVASFLASTRTGLVRDWLEECEKFKKRHGVSDCREGTNKRSASMTAQQAGIAALFQASVEVPSDAEDKRIVAETNYLRTLMDENPVVGDLARQRYALLRDTYCMSNGDQQGCTGSSFRSPAGDVITLVTVAITLGGVKMNILGKAVSLDFAGVPSPRPVSPLLQPMESPASSDDVDDNEFRVEPPLFPLR